MAYFVRPDIDFVNRPYKVPNQNESPDFAQFLIDKEDDIMKSLLGWELWDALKTAMADGGYETPNDSTEYLAQKYIDLIDGAQYTYLGDTWKWEGLNKMLVPALYGYWLPEYIKLMNIGVIQNLAEPDKSEVVSPGHKISRAWNEFWKRAGGWVGTDYDHRNTLYGFMMANYETDYTTWFPTDDWNPELPDNPNQLNL